MTTPQTPETPAIYVNNQRVTFKTPMTRAEIIVLSNVPGSTSVTNDKNPAVQLHSSGPVSVNDGDHFTVA